MTKTDPNSPTYWAGLLIGAFLLTCLRAQLLSLCAAIFFPDFVLTFWQWALLAFTLRTMLMPTFGGNND